MTADAFQVQRCTDVARAAELHAFTQSIFGALDINPPSSVLKETAADFAARLRDEICFVVDADEKLIASIFCAMDGDALYVGRLAVRPDWRRRRVASALIDAAKAEATRIGVTTITLRARIALASNIALFRRQGFAIVGEHSHPGFAVPTSYEMALTLS